MAGAPQPSNRRERRNAAQEVAREFLRAGMRKEPFSLSRLALSWGVVGTGLFFIWGGAITFMTSSHPVLADIFYLGGAALLITKLLSWEEAKKHERRGLIAFLVFVALLMVGAIWGNHRLNAAPEPEYHTVADRHLTISQADSLRAGLERVNFISSVMVGAPQDDGEAWDYAAELASSFSNARLKAGWKVNSLVPVPEWDASPGVTLLVWQGGERSVSEQQIDLAFIEADLPPPKHGVSPKLRRGEVAVWVGRKD